MTFFKSGVKKSRCTQLSVGLATLFVTSTFLFGGESVKADSVARGDDYPSISGGCILASVPLLRPFV